MRDGFAEPGGAGTIVLSYDRPAATITVRGFVMVLAGFLFFKAAIIAHLGAEAYNDALINLRHGAWPEQGAALIMVADPVSQAIAVRLSPLM